MLLAEYEIICNLYVRYNSNIYVKVFASRQQNKPSESEVDMKMM